MTIPQHMEALATANVVRLERARLHRQVHDVGEYAPSCAELAKVLRDGPPACMSSMRVEQALRWVWHMGPSRVQQCLTAAGCSPWKKVGDLSPRQRDRIVGVLMGWAYRKEAA